MSAEETEHALDRVFRQVPAVHDVTRTGNADLGAAATELTPPSEAALCLLDHAFGWLVITHPRCPR